MSNASNKRYTAMHYAMKCVYMARGSAPAVVTVVAPLSIHYSRCNPLKHFKTRVEPFLNNFKTLSETF